MKPLFTAILCTLCIASHAQYKYNRIDINAGTQDSYHDVTKMIVHNGKLFMPVYHPSYGLELFSTDGTATGTSLVKDIYPGLWSNDIFGLTSYNGSLYFAAREMTNGTELWTTDGTEAGTKIVKKIFEDYRSGIRETHREVTVLNGKLIFAAIDTVPTGIELWQSDGTDAGTSILKDIIVFGTHPDPHTYGSEPKNFSVQGSKMYFSAINTSSSERVLYETNGTAGGTKRIEPGVAPGYIATDFFYVHNGGLYYSKAGGQLWRYNISTGQATMLKDIDPRTFGVSGFPPMAELNGKLYFTATDSTHGFELWTTDGTAVGTYMVKDIQPGIGGSVPQLAGSIVYKNKLYFSAQDTTDGTEIWVTDGTEAGTKQFANIFTDTKVGGFKGIIEYADKLFFYGRHAQGWQIYETDGSTAGTRILQGPNVSGTTMDTNYYAAKYHEPSGFTMYNNALYFFARWDSTGMELWSLQDTTIPIVNVATNTNVINPVTMFPNPAKNSISIKIGNAFAKGAVTIRDMAGRIIKTEMLHTANAERLYNIPIHDIPSGMYMTEVMIDDKRTIERLVIQ